MFRNMLDSAVLTILADLPSPIKWVLYAAFLTFIYVQRKSKRDKKDNHNPEGNQNQGQGDGAQEAY